MLRISRLGSAFIIAVFAAGPIKTTFAQEQNWRHASGLINEPKYAADFPHFDYVNPDAPKGGALRLSETGSFDTLNPILPKGEIATGLGLVYETLTMSSMDEVSTDYGLLAEALSYPDDYSSVTYRLRENARWHDGKSVSADDVVWSFEKITELSPQQAFYYQHVTSAEALDAQTVKFTFDEKDNKELPQIVGQLLVMPKHWWQGANESGEKRDIAGSTLEPPLGSGPYRITGINPGSTVTYSRVEDYWGANEPVNIGSHNLDTITYNYYRDRNVQFQAFKADEFDYWSENEAKRWATAYDFPAAKEGKIARIEPENEYRSTGIMIGFIPNLRIEKFKDARVRRALNYAFDFEALNSTIFFDQYERIDSFYYGLEFDASDALPVGRELEILEEVRDQVPEAVFGEMYQNPVAGSQKKLRGNLREALRLFKEAGYEQQDGKLTNSKTGEAFTFEILLNGPIIERVALPWIEDLRKIGVDATVRSVEPSQYVTRLRSRDFDMIYSGWLQSNSLGNEQFDFFGSNAAGKEASRNYGGVADPAVDAIIQKIVFATDRDELVAASRALDRVMMANQFVIPTYALRSSRLAFWDRFSAPDPLPEYAVGFPTIWWFDDAKAEKTK